MWTRIVKCRARPVRALPLQLRAMRGIHAHDNIDAHMPQTRKVLSRQCRASEMLRIGATNKHENSLDRCGAASLDPCELEIFFPQERIARPQQQRTVRRYQS